MSDIEQEERTEVAPSGMGRGLEAYARDEKLPRMWSAEMQLAEMRLGGEDGLLDRITDDLLAGSDHRGIAETLGVRTGEMCRWIFATVEREAAYRAVLRVKADMLVHEGFGVIRGVDVEGENAGAKVALAKLETDYMWKAAGKWDRKNYGEEKGAVNVGVGVKFVISQDDVGLL